MLGDGYILSKELTMIHRRRKGLTIRRRHGVLIMHGMHVSEGI